MRQQIKLIYIDDKLDTLLVEYLYSFRKDDIIISYNEIEFDSRTQDFESLLTDSRVLESDMILNYLKMNWRALVLNLQVKNLDFFKNS